MTIIICDALGNLVPFVQFKKRENTHEGVLLFVKLQPEFLQNGITPLPERKLKNSLEFLLEIWVLLKKLPLKHIEYFLLNIVIYCSNYKG